MTDYTKGMTVPQMIEILARLPSDARFVHATSYLDDVSDQPEHFSHRVVLTLRYPPKPKPRVDMVRREFEKPMGDFITCGPLESV